MVKKPSSGWSATLARRLSDGLTLLAILLLPLLGWLWSGRDCVRIFQFPPVLDIPTSYLHFSRMAMTAVMLALLAVVAPWFFRRRLVAFGLRCATRNRFELVAHKFPWWGWLALGWTLGWWALAWHRWTWFAEIQRFTFFPLWVGFIVVVSGLTQRRTGQCMMRTKPGQWLALFGLSAVFWWIFEWLNRFAGNWHYLGVEDFGAWSYALHATFCFSTVLPAVAVVAEWLGTHPTWLHTASRGPVWSWLLARGTGPLFFLGGVGALLGTGIWPNLFYPALWTAPLALLLGLSLWRGQSALAREMARGDWQRA
ncbi:MAG: hypothetical protein K9M98_07820, partial [Cephaloticoccus sp.]|nr:hypothetical protein [Cephaloticoccus sp.]